MNPVITGTTFFDGEDEIIYSNSFNIYENKLIIKDFLGFTINFIFAKEEPKEGQRDMEFSGNGKIATVKFSKKIRNTLGSGNTSKFPLVKFEDGRKLFFTLYGSGIGNESDALNVTVTFYLKST